MASLTWWTWVWVNSGSWWWTGRPGVLRFMGLQRVGHYWVTDLIWCETWTIFPLCFLTNYCFLWKLFYFHLLTLCPDILLNFLIFSNLSSAALEFYRFTISSANRYSCISSFLIFRNKLHKDNENSRKKILKSFLKSIYHTCVHMDTHTHTHTHINLLEQIEASILG